MTHAPEAQDIEKQIHQIWRVCAENPRAHVNAVALLARLDDVARAIGRLNVEYDQWQVVYRKSVQLGRALRGEPQLLQAVVEPLADSEPTNTENPMASVHRQPTVHRPLADVPARFLVQQTIQQAKQLVQKEVELAKAEVKADLKREVGMVKALAVASICALCGLNLLLVALATTLAASMPGWAAVLIVAAGVLAVGAVFAVVGWSKRVRTPLARTRKSLKEDLRWLKERTA
jgi:hypothetical protein